MEPYIICFAFTLAWAWINEKLLEKNVYNALTWMSAGLVILLPAMLAGFRDYNVGTDVYVYAKPTLDTVIKLGWEGVTTTKVYETKGIEYGFKILAYVSSQFSSSLHFFLFIISFLISSLVYFALYNLRTSCSIFMGELVYLFACYNETYNMMRQCLAMAFVLVAVCYILKKKYGMGMLFVAFGYAFHVTAIIALPILIIIYFMDKKIESKELLRFKYSLKWILLAFLLIGLVLFFKDVFILFVNKGILPARYDSYIQNAKGMLFAWNDFIKYVFPYVFLFLCKKNINYCDGFLAMALCDVMFYQLRTQVEWFYRVSSYFFYIRILSFSYIKLNTEYLCRNKRLSINNLCAFLLIIYLVYWWYIYSISSNMNETYPYTSVLLDVYF